MRYGLPLALAFCLAIAPPVRAATPPLGVVTNARGQVQVRGADGEWHELKLLDKLSGQELLRTAPNASVELTLPDGGTVRVGPGSTFALSGSSEAAGAYVVTVAAAGPLPGLPEVRAEAGSTVAVTSSPTGALVSVELGLAEAPDGTVLHAHEGWSLPGGRLTAGPLVAPAPPAVLPPPLAPPLLFNPTLPQAVIIAPPGAMPAETGGATIGIE